MTYDCEIGQVVSLLLYSLCDLWLSLNL